MKNYLRFNIAQEKQTSQNERHHFSGVSFQKLQQWGYVTKSCFSVEYDPSKCWGFCLDGRADVFSPSCDLITKYSPKWFFHDDFTMVKSTKTHQQDTSVVSPGVAACPAPHSPPVPTTWAQCPTLLYELGRHGHTRWAPDPVIKPLKMVKNTWETELK